MQAKQHSSGTVKPTNVLKEQYGKLVVLAWTRDFHFSLDYDNWLRNKQ